MEEKTRKVKVKTPFLEYTWIKKINKTKTKKKFIQSQIDSFIILIEKKDSVKLSLYKNEFTEFCRLITAQGHLSKLDKEYQDKFFEINKVLKELNELKILSG